MEQSPDDLGLAITPLPIEVGQFNVLKSGALNTGNLLVNCHVIGSSSAIEWQHNGITLWEVLACQPLQEVTPLEALSVAGTEIRTDHPSDKFVHIFRLWTLPLSDLVKQLSELEYWPFKLHQEFPGSSPDAEPAYTIIGGFTEPTRIVLKTLHSYPDHGLVVMTSSQLEPRS